MYTKSFDIINYLEDNGIDYSTEGKNVSAGWINIKCPFCEDTSNHCGVNLDSKLFSCWVCGEKGGPYKLIRAIDGSRYDTIQTTLKKYQDYTIPVEDEDYSERTDKIKMPKGVMVSATQRHLKYLKKRNFDSEYIVRKYKLLFGGPYGDFRHRIIIPYFKDDRLVTMTGRTIINADPPYYNLPTRKSILDTKETLYNIDTVTKNYAIIVEGPLDVWRIGDGCIATSGTKYTSEQLTVLRKKHLKRLFILFDHTAYSEAQRLSKQVSLFIDHVEIIRLSHGDPAELTNEEARHLKKSICD